MLKHKIKKTKNQENREILFLGAQGSGKGTQADILASKIGIPHISSGDLIRVAIHTHTPIGEKARSYYDRGELVPDEIIVAMLLGRLTESDCTGGFILDGFPRTLTQAQSLDKALAAHGRGLNQIVYLKADPTVLVKRISNRYICRAQQHPYNIVTNPPKIKGICDIDGSELYQRSDDAEEAVKHRMEIFFSETIKLISYYKKHIRVHEVNGEQPIPDVSKDILGALKVE